MTTITPDMLKVIATADRIAKRMGGRFVPADTGETEAQEAAMQDDVERVARALCRLNGLCVGFCHTERCPTAVRDYGDQARAAMVATLELTAEALHLALQSGEVGGRSYETADWLQQRANAIRAIGAP